MLKGEHIRIGDGVRFDDAGSHGIGEVVGLDPDQEGGIEATIITCDGRAILRDCAGLYVYKPDRALILIEQNGGKNDASTG